MLQWLGKVQTVLHAKEEERSRIEQERDRLAKKLADQADRHQEELQKLQDAEKALEAEFETQRSSWVDKEKALTDGYGEIEDMLDGKSFFSFFCLPTCLTSRPMTLCLFFVFAQNTFLVMPFHRPGHRGLPRGAKAG